VTESTVSLRGAQVSPPSPALGTWLLAVIAVMLVGLSVALLATAIGNTARMSRLNNHGIEATATVTLCRGNLGGSGSNLASYTCSGRYVIHGRHYESVIGGLSTFVQTGAAVAVVADPQDLAVVETLAAAKAIHVALMAYAVPGILFVAAVGSAVMALTTKRRRVTHGVREGTAGP
jgi:hypothetical protein